MASFANRTPNPQTHDMVSVMAQAKPAIISPSTPVSGYLNSQAVPRQEHNKATDALSEKINATLNLNSPSNVTNNQIDTFNHNQESVKFNLEPKVRFIEDDNIIRKQNASNQMRQAAVMAAVASQQKVRLSATERLALTAKRPPVQPPPKPALTQVQHPPISRPSQPPLQPQSQPQPQLQPQQLHKTQPQPQQPTKIQTQTQPQAQPNDVKNSTPSSALKAAPMLTLKTLLAVQRQLQQHTKQHLNDGSVHSSQSFPSAQQTSHWVEAEFESKQQAARGKLLPPSPPKSPCSSMKPSNGSSVYSMDTYDKDLPPLPSSISPSTSTDDSQLNSLESHQSSPATSLVSLPPPPPPISSYLQQYDEVNGCHRASPSSSSPSTASTCEISSVRQFPTTVPQQFITETLRHEQNRINTALASAGINKQLHNKQEYSTKVSTSLDSLEKQSPSAFNTQVNNKSVFREAPAPNYQASSNVSNQTIAAYFHNVQQNELKPHLNDCSNSLANQDALLATQQTQVSYIGMNHAQRSSHSASNFSSSPSFLPPPPPPLSMSDYNESVGFDQPDSGNFRFPTPPPPEMLLNDVSSASDSEEEEDDDDDENADDKDTLAGKFDFPEFKSKVYTGQLPIINDRCSNNGTDLDEDNDGKEKENEDDYQCRIPTPPMQKSMLVNGYPTANNQSKDTQRNQLEPLVDAKSSAIFDASTFSARSMHMSLQPPPLFRQQSLHQPLQQAMQKQQPQLPQTQHHNPHQYQRQQTTKTASMQPQLTVHINNDGGCGLLSTAPANPMDHQLDVSHQHHHNHLQHLQHHHIMMTMTTSSSSPSSSSDGDGQSSNSSSSTSGIHSSIDSPSLSNLNDFNYCGRTLMSNKNIPSSTNNFSSTKLSSKNEVLTTKSHRCLTSVNNPNHEPNPAPAPIQPAKPRPALKQKKSVSFSDKVELVACADEQTEDHLPNPLLARVLAGRLQ